MTAQFPGAKHNHMKLGEIQHDRRKKVITSRHGLTKIYTLFFYRVNALFLPPTPTPGLSFVPWNHTLA